MCVIFATPALMCLSRAEVVIPAGNTAGRVKLVALDQTSLTNGDASATLRFCNRVKLSSEKLLRVQVVVCNRRYILCGSSDVSVDQALERGVAASWISAQVVLVGWVVAELETIVLLDTVIPIAC